MTITATRRGFLAGLLGTTVIAVLPKAASIADAAPVLQPYDIAAPSGWTYQWVATHVMGEPMPQNVEVRLNNGWTFVPPVNHPTVPAVDIARAVDGGGLILMQKETRLIAPPKAYPLPGLPAGLKTADDPIFDRSPWRRNPVTSEPEWLDGDEWINHAEWTKRQQA